MQFKIIFENNQYNNYELRDVVTLEYTHLNNFNPKEHKIFNFDVFEYNETTKKINILHSMIKNMPKISGILVLNNNKTYGKNTRNFTA